MHWEKSVPCNLFQVAGITVHQCSDKRGLTIFGTDSGIDLIVKTHLGHFIIIQPNFLKFGTTWFRFSFLFTYVCSCKFLRKLALILQKLIEPFLIYHCLCFFTTRWHLY